MHDALFRNQGRVGPGRLSYRKLAEQIGLDGARFETEMSGPQVREKVTADIRLGQELGVRGTPTVFLNGRQLPVVGNERLWRHYLQLPRPVAESRPAGAP
jgi:protein-disulfide isomerase